MGLNKINGSSYYIDAPTNIGVFSFKNKNCLLIDTGINNSAARKIDALLKENNLHVKYILNTHSHPDHCGGNAYFKETYTGSIVYASSKESLYMENLELRPNMLFGATALKVLADDCKTAYVDMVPDYGTIKINDEKFEVLSLKGHSPEGIGLITQDRVCYLGDSLFSSSILEKYAFPYLYHIEDSLNTLEKIKEIDADYFVVSHGSQVYNREETTALAGRNAATIQHYLDEILELLDKPLTREDLLESILILDNLEVSFRQYHILYSSMSAFLSHLVNKGQVEHTVENGKVYYYK